jgi:hypothetical protein
MIKECVREHSVRGKLAHHDHFKPIVTAPKPVLAEELDHALRFAKCANKGNHDLDVRQAPAHVVAYVAKRLTRGWRTHWI